MKAVVFGSRGQLGFDLIRWLSKSSEVFSFSREEVDITDLEKVKKIIFEIRPDFVFNATGWNNVDGAEKVENAERVFSVNSFSPYFLLLLCKEISATFINVSTDYVFDGKKRLPYEEQDEPNPLSVYALSKLLGELLIKKSGYSKFIIVRSGGLYGVNGSYIAGRTYRNFVERVIENISSQKKMRIVYDVFSAPTYTFDLARKIVELAKEGFTGIVHIMQIGEISWYDFSRLIANLLHLDDRFIEPITLAELRAPAQRPNYSVLKNSVLEKLGKNDMMSVEDALKSYLKERGLIL